MLMDTTTNFSGSGVYNMTIRRFVGPPQEQIADPMCTLSLNHRSIMVYSAYSILAKIGGHLAQHMS